MKKLFSLFLLVALISVPLTSVVKADGAEETSVDTTSENFSLETQIDENTTKTTNKYFDLTLSEGLQSPLDKSIIYTLTIVPHIDSSKTQITWDSSSTIKITPKHSEFVSVSKDGEYTYKAKVRPTVSGVYKINVSVVSWQYDANYTNTVNNSLVLSAGLVSLPVTPEYTILVVIEILVILAISALAIWGGIELSKKFLKKAKTWLTPPR